MSAEIYFAGNPTPILTTQEWDAQSIAHALAGNDRRATRVADFFEIDLNDGYRVLINPKTVAYVRNVSP